MEKIPNNKYALIERPLVFGIHFDVHKQLYYNYNYYLVL